MHAAPELLEVATVDGAFLELPAAPEGEEVLWDFVSTGLTLRSHPVRLLRPRLNKFKLKPSRQLRTVVSGEQVQIVGIVTLRPQPGTANGTVFVPLRGRRRLHTDHCVA